MAYIGRDTDKISNVEVLDNITFDGSSSYTLQKSSVNFTPSSANTLLLSIDGIVQAGNFTVSGSTIDFGTAVAGTSTCNFVLHYGVGLITAPSDATVTTAKVADGAITSAKLASGVGGVAGITSSADGTAITIDSSENVSLAQNLSFNSGYGSSATAYGVRAWVNFNGKGTPAIRASGNVSSITDVSTGRYKVNFATNMPDADYAVTVASQQENNNDSQVHNIEAPNVAYIEFQRRENGTVYDSLHIFVTVTR